MSARQQKQNVVRITKGASAILRSRYSELIIDPSYLLTVDSEYTVSMAVDGLAGWFADRPGGWTDGRRAAAVATIVHK